MVSLLKVHIKHSLLIWPRYKILEAFKNVLLCVGSSTTPAWSFLVDYNEYPGSVFVYAKSAKQTFAVF